MYLSAHEGFSNLLGEAGVWYLYSQNIRHVEQLIGALRDNLGIRAFERFSWVNISSLQEEAEVWIEQAESATEASLIGGLTVNEIKKTSDDTRIHFVNGVYVQLPESDTGRFGTKASNYATCLQGEVDPYSSSQEPSPGHLLYENKENAPVALNQGLRGTCVAFSICAAAESLMLSWAVRNGDASRPKPLSKQWVYYKAKLEDPVNEYSPGTTLKLMAQACENHGFVLDESLGYRDKPDEAQALWFKESPGLDKLEREGKLLRLTSHRSIRATDVSGLKAALHDGHCVMMVVPVYQRAWLSPYVVSRGEVELPFMDPKTDEILDERQGFHAITLYGYKDTPEDVVWEVPRPGGGYFIFRNSWGESWGKNRSETPAGYGMLPYAYIELFAADALILTEITHYDQDDRPIKVYRL